MRKINLYGGPGIGKSTVAALIFSGLKVRGCNAELINEYAKELVYEGIDLKKQNNKYLQMRILMEQIRRELIFQDKVDYLISDSPLMLNAFYNEDETAVAMAKINSKDGDLHFFFQRGFENFESKGRSHSKTDSIEIDDKMLNFLLKHKINIQIISGTSIEKAESILKILGV